MMISNDMMIGLNKQIVNELSASHHYLAMAYAFEGMGLKVFAQRFFKQAEEERGHALKIGRYVLEVGGRVVLDAVSRPRGDYASARQIIEAAVESEKTVTRQINSLVAHAEKEKDFATRSFLQWFVDEQVEEVASMSDLLQMITLAGDQNLFQVEGRLLNAMKE